MIECDYFIGRTFYLEKAFKKARNYFETYLATRDQRYVEEAKYCLDVIDQRTDSITKIPLKIIQESYNVYADFYNKIIEANIQNSPQHKLSQLIIKYLNEISKSPINKGVDLGCGTGLVGKQIKATKGINYLIGVDIAERMLEEAKILKEGTELVYNETIHLDVDEYIAQTLKKEKFDIFIACSLLNYYSEVKKLFENCAKLAKPGALLCFTFRTHEQSTLGLFNGNIEEFSYSPALLKKLLLDLGWKLTDEGEIKLLDGGSGMYIISQHK
jgi:predicted TPR repeat methyltransferase